MNRGSRLFAGVRRHSWWLWVVIGVGLAIRVGWAMWIAVGPVSARDRVTGYTRYRIDGDVEGDDAVLAIVDRGGVAAQLRSRTEGDPRLRGTKQLVALEREVTAAPASIPDNAGGIAVTRAARARSRRFRKVWCDAGFKTTFIDRRRRHHAAIEVVISSTGIVLGCFRNDVL